MSDTRTVRARVTGQVQGVAFRAWTEAEAGRRGLSGWVRNEPDGAVLALIHGPTAQVDAMITALHEGPGAAAVANVAVEDVSADPPPEGFRITR